MLRACDLSLLRTNPQSAALTLPPSRAQACGSTYSTELHYEFRCRLCRTCVVSLYLSLFPPLLSACRSLFLSSPPSSLAADSPALASQLYALRRRGPNITSLRGGYDLPKIDLRDYEEAEKAEEDGRDEGEASEGEEDE